MTGVTFSWVAHLLVDILQFHLSFLNGFQKSSAKRVQCSRKRVKRVRSARSHAKTRRTASDRARALVAGQSCLGAAYHQCCSHATFTA
eukprot:7168218-Karenia_brevis.AAC.1